MRLEGFNPVALRGSSLPSADSFSALVVETRSLFGKAGALNKSLVAKALISGKPVAFVSFEGIDSIGLTNFIKRVLVNHTLALKNILSSLGEKSYEINYNSSGAITSNQTVQDINYVVILKLTKTAGYNHLVPHLYILTSSGTDIHVSRERILNFLANYLKEAVEK